MRTDVLVFVVLISIGSGLFMMPEPMKTVGFCAAILTLVGMVIYSLVRRGRRKK